MKPVLALLLASTCAAPNSHTVAASRERQTTRLLSVTSYCATGHRTASGVWPRVGMAASNLYPLGTRLYVPGWGAVTVIDRVGAHSDLDLFAPSCAAAVRWGRRAKEVSEL